MPTPQHPNTPKPCIAIIGLGYVGLPLAVAFAEKYSVIGFDINEKRVAELKSGHDHTLEIEDDLLRSVLVESIENQHLEASTQHPNKNSAALNQKPSPNKGQPPEASPQKPHKGLLISSNPADLQQATVFIVTVPTPTDKHNRPVLTPMIKATEMIGKVLVESRELRVDKSRELRVESVESQQLAASTQPPIIIYESTVYPGVTEEEMVPVLEHVSGMKFNQDFFVGYSPERINPGDKEHTVTKILKVTSGSTPEAAEYVDQLYKSIITAGTHKAPSIKVAEAAKVIENSQRDINIAFVNELSKIFSKLGIDTNEVLEAAGTKWNFLPFKPGLVGGHCIGVDPFYLAQKAQEVGYHPEIILAGRRLNDGMGQFVASEVVRLMIGKGIPVQNAKCLILGFTFKENCPDVRNTKVIDVYHAIKSFHMEPVVYDPWANPEEVMHEYGIKVVNQLPTSLEFEIESLTPESSNSKLQTPLTPSPPNYSAAILAVSHKEFQSLKIRDLVGTGVVYDVKGVLKKEDVDARL